MDNDKRIDEHGAPLCQAVSDSGVQCEGHDGHYHLPESPHFAGFPDNSNYLTWIEVSHD